MMVSVSASAAAYSAGVRTFRRGAAPLREACRNAAVPPSDSAGTTARAPAATPSDFSARRRLGLWVFWRAWSMSAIAIPYVWDRLRRDIHRLAAPRRGVDGLDQRDAAPALAAIHP